jgi:thiamine phosphate synthase YjbQ (UPF0047 family)
MQIFNEIIEIKTDKQIEIYNITPLIENILAKTSIQNGQVL